MPFAFLQRPTKQEEAGTNGKARGGRLEGECSSGKVSGGASSRASDDAASSVTADGRRASRHGQGVEPKGVYLPGVYLEVGHVGPERYPRYLVPGTWYLVPGTWYLRTYLGSLPEAHVGKTVGLDSESGGNSSAAGQSNTLHRPPASCALMIDSLRELLHNVITPMRKCAS